MPNDLFIFSKDKEVVPMAITVKMPDLSMSMQMLFDPYFFWFMFLIITTT